MREAVAEPHPRSRQEATPDEAAMLWAAAYLLMGLRRFEESAARLLQG